MIQNENISYVLSIFFDLVLVFGIGIEGGNLMHKHAKTLYAFAFIAFSLPSLLIYNNCAKSNLITNTDHLNSLESSSSSADIIPGTNTNTSTGVQYQLIYNNPDWTIDAGCMTNSAFEACLVWKNPVAYRYLLSNYNPNISIFANSMGVSWPLKKGSDISNITTLGVNISKYSNSVGLLTNNFIDVFASSNQTNPSNYLRTHPVSGKYKFSYATDDQYNFSQLMAFYWINYAKDFFEKKSVPYFSASSMTGKPKIPVDAFNTTDSSLKNNGYFAWNPADSVQKWGLVALGAVMKDNVNVDHELALSAEAYIHEMGHANLFYARGGPTNTTQGADSNGTILTNAAGQSVKLCNTALGCFRAINEGQADFHSHILFEQQPYLLETYTNRATGPGDRNATILSTYTAQNFYKAATITFNGSTHKGEIHAIGAFYGSILFKIYTDARTDKQGFMKVFMGHLQMLDSSSTFATVKQDLINVDNSFNQGRHRQVIIDEFTRRGL